VWGLVLLGGLILLIGVSQPLVLLVISACVGGAMMFIYSILLIVLNPPGAARPDPPPGLPRRRDGLGGPAVRRVLGADDLATGREAAGGRLSGPAAT
jgi:hypothetical protein